jgi:hypothetical protein
METQTARRSARQEDIIKPKRSGVFLSAKADSKAQQRRESPKSLDWAVVKNSKRYNDESGIWTHALSDQRIADDTMDGVTLSWRLRPLGHLTGLNLDDSMRKGWDVQIK